MKKISEIFYNTDGEINKTIYDDIDVYCPNCGRKNILKSQNISLLSEYIQSKIGFCCEYCDAKFSIRMYATLDELRGDVNE